jgi:Lipocalin-like domain
VPKSSFTGSAHVVGGHVSPSIFLRTITTNLARQRVSWRAQNREEYMHRRNVLSIFAIVGFSLALMPDGAVGQQKSIKEQIVGVWTLVSFDSFDGSGAKIPNMEGSNLKGQSVFADNGRMSVQMISEFPKLASNDRLKTTTAEEKAVAHGILSYFGSYTVNEADKTVSLNIERSSFPNQVASSVKRVATFTGDELKLDNPGRLAGGRTVTVWRRVK